MRRLLALLLVAALVAFGCGDDDDDADDADAPTTTEVEVDPEADEAAAEEINLTEADLADWQATPAGPDDADDDELDAEMRECVGLPPKDDENPTADVDSDDFTQGQMQISSSVTFLTTEELAQEQRDAYASEDAEGCVEEIFGRFITDQLPGATVDELEVERLTASDDLGDGGFAYRLNLSLSAQGQSATLVSDYRGVLVGRAGIGLTTVSVGDPVDEDLQQELLEKMVERAEDAA
jgi:hypothetical protein